MLHVDQVLHTYGSLKALDGLDLSVSAGECFGLLGPNGAGKSTLMSLIAGLRKPTSGRIQISDTDAGGEDFRRRNLLGYCPQHIALYLKLSARRNLEIFGGLHGLSGSKLRERIDTLLQAVGLLDRAKDDVGTFSGGMQRRLNLAAALLHEPKLLLCDEPTVGVDPQSRNAIFEFLEARRAEGLTIIYSTHYMEEATRLCDRIGIIDHGRLLAVGTLEELLTRLPYGEEIAFRPREGSEALKAWLEPQGVLREQNGEILFQSAPTFRLSSLYLKAEELGWPDQAFTQRRPTLEAVFLQLTGRSLRD